MASEYVERRIAEIEASREMDTAQAIILPVIREARKTKSLASARIGYTYFIRSGNLVKIGFSSDVESRLANLQVGNPEKSKLIAAIPGTEDTELYFHKMFASYRQQGEWFRVEGELAKFLRVAPAMVAIPERKVKEEPDDDFRL